MEEIPQDKLWAIYKTLSGPLKDAIFSEDTAEAIWNICKLHDVNERASVAKIVGRVLMGLLPPEILKGVLEDELKINEEKAKKLTMEIEHFILNPVKDDLDALYKEGGTKREKPAGEEKEPPKKEDAYREPVE